MNSTPASPCLCPSVRRPLTAATSAWPSLTCPCPRCSFAPSPGLLLLREQKPPPCCSPESSSLHPPSTHEPSFSPNDISYFLRPPSPSDLVFIFQILSELLEGQTHSSHGQDYGRLELGARNWIQVSRMGGRGQLCEPSAASSQGAHEQEQLGLARRPPDTGVHIGSGLFRGPVVIVSYIPGM